MTSPDDAVRALREALAFSPDNVPLRRHLADTLRGFGRFDDAEKEYREVLKRAPDDAALKLTLARCYLDGGKASHALVILDALVLRGELSAAGEVVRARCLLGVGDPSAASVYRRAIERDPAVVDEELSRKFGSTPAPAKVAADGDAQEVDADADTSEPESAIAERPKITFADVGGMQSVKDEIAIKIIEPLRNPEIFAAYGKKIGGGILMYGPPGCGKTHLARATAGEVKARFLSIGIHDVLDMYLGNSERNLHAIFEEARRSTPCVLFFDEVDALGAKRADFAGTAGRNVINQFLNELDGVKSTNEGVLVLAATNAPWSLDSAFRRPGRFDRILFVPPPDAPARASILRVLVQGKPVGAIDFERVASKTKDFSGADLKAVVDLALESLLRDALKRGSPKPLDDKVLIEAAKQVNPSTKEWFASARNHVLYANQGGIYDDVAKYLGL
jgi:transitional endoplasmic reticulum ATPase